MLFIQYLYVNSQKLNIHAPHKRLFLDKDIMKITQIYIF